jgi:hypothetical protein
MPMSSLDAVKSFLMTFYYPEFFTDAILKSSKYLREFPEERQEYSDAFYDFLDRAIVDRIDFVEFTLDYGNRKFDSQEEAIEFMYEVFKRNVLDLRDYDPEIFKNVIST